MNTSLIIRALMNAGMSYSSAVREASDSMEADSRVAVIRLLAGLSASPKPARLEFANRFRSFHGGINRFQ